MKPYTPFTTQGDTSIDLDAYLARISYNGPLENSRRTFYEIHKLHVRTIPFENLDPLSGHPISINLQDIEEKLIHRRRGGYCFEHNSLFSAALQQLGFTVSPSISRVRWQTDPSQATPASHMVLVVTVDGEDYLADVGFGGLGLIEPISLEMGKIQHEDFEPRRVVQSGPETVHQIRINGEWSDVYQFSNNHAYPIDLEMANWYSCTHPKARFTRSLLVTLATEQGRKAITDDEFMVRIGTQKSVRTKINSQEELEKLLDAEFRLSIGEKLSLNCPTLPWLTGQ